MFSEVVWELRLKRKLLLREFCRLALLDVRSWSRVEQGFELPPQDDETLRRIASVLALSDDEFQSFRSEALNARVKKPSEKEFVNTLPMFCRTFGNKKPAKEKLFRIASILRPSQNA